jgi:BCD family chlorophyll transporter-like MFS transporter
MGLWGAAQAIAFAIGGFSGTVFADLARAAFGAAAPAYGFVFLCEAALFLVSALLAARLAGVQARGLRLSRMKEAVS